MKNGANEQNKTVPIKWFWVAIKQNHFEMGGGSKGWEAISAPVKFSVHYLCNERYIMQLCQSNFLPVHRGLFSFLNEWSGTGSEETS